MTAMIWPRCSGRLGDPARTHGPHLDKCRRPRSARRPSAAVFAAAVFAAAVFAAAVLAAVLAAVVVAVVVADCCLGAW
jgi:hypothetical protein